MTSETPRELMERERELEREQLRYYLDLDRKWWFFWEKLNRSRQAAVEAVVRNKFPGMFREDVTARGNTGHSTLRRKCFEELEARGAEWALELEPSPVPKELEETETYLPEELR